MIYAQCLILCPTAMLVGMRVALYEWKSEIDLIGGWKKFEFFSDVTFFKIVKTHLTYYLIIETNETSETLFAVLNSMGIYLGCSISPG